MINIRLGMYHREIKKVKEFIEMVKKYPGSCDVIWIASPYGYPMPESVKKLSNELISIRKLFDEAGIRVAMQLSNSLGGHGTAHKSTDCSAFLFYDFENCMNYDGEINPYAYCPNGKVIREYIEEVVAELCKCKPEVLWVDDDLRLERKNQVKKGCFCPTCMGLFNKMNGSNYSREELVKKLNSGCIETRKSWTAFCRKNLGDFAELIMTAAKKTNKDIVGAFQFGFMTNYLGDNYDHVLEGMKRATGKAPAVRPGGGIYDEKNLQGFLDKAYNIEHAFSHMPDYVEYRVPEIENTPDVNYGKTPYATCFEATVDMMYGCRQLSFAIIMVDNEPICYKEKWLEAIAKNKKYWEKLSEINKRSYAYGGELVHARYDAYNKPCENFEYDKIPNLHGTSLRALAIPETHEKGHNPFAILPANLVDYLSDSDIEELLNKPVLTDAKAVKLLCERGFAEKLGINVRKVDISEEICRERFLDGSLYTGAYSPITGTEAYYLDDCEGIIEKYSDIVYAKKRSEIGICSAVVKLKTGAAWAISGFSLWAEAPSSRKRAQIAEMVDAITNHTMKVITDYAMPMNIRPRVDKDGNIVCVNLINLTISPTEDIVLLIRGVDSLNYTYENGDFEKKIVGTKVEDGVKVIIPGFVRGWDAATLFCE